MACFCIFTGDQCTSTAFMEEIEPPTEHLHEQINEGAEHGREHWMVWVALSTAMLAVFAAIASLFANHHSDEALVSQIKSSDRWSYYQAKGIKSLVLSSTSVMLQAMGKPEIPANAEKIKDNKTEQEKAKKEAEALEAESQKHIEIHEELAKAVTIFQIAIAISAITILTRRKPLWFISMALTVLGIYFLIFGLLM